MSEQYDFFTDPIPLAEDAGSLSKSEQFRAWKRQPGAKQVLRQVYRFAYRYGKRYEATGRRVSVKLIWELTRDHIRGVRARCRLKGIALKDWRGYSLNNIFTAYIARHIEDHRPEWKGLFERRMTDEERAEAEIKEMKEIA